MPWRALTAACIYVSLLLWFVFGPYVVDWKKGRKIKRLASSQSV